MLEKAHSLLFVSLAIVDNENPTNSNKWNREIWRGRNFIFSACT